MIEFEKLVYYNLQSGAKAPERGIFYGIYGNIQGVV